ncbi:unnamed protein product, partial [marine sediment metagenome]
MSENFCFIVDIINFKGKLPFEVIPGHWFRKATTEEIQRIKQELSNRSSIPDIIFFKYEQKFVPAKETGSSRQSVPLPPEDWRYYVISFKGPNDNIMDIEYSANLLKHDINIGFTFLSHEGKAFGVLYNLYILSTFFADQRIGFQQEISFGPNELLEINTNYNNITNLDNLWYANIFRAISDLHQTKMITNHSVLKVLSYFSIIECLLTHVPRPIDTIDSLTRQVSTKMSLLSNLFQRELDYTLHFPQLQKPEKVWRKLYSYRSTVAHGGEANFDGDFS